MSRNSRHEVRFEKAEVACSWPTQIIDTVSKSELAITVVRRHAFGVARVAPPLCSILLQSVASSPLQHSAPRCSVFHRGAAFCTTIHAVLASHGAAFCATVMRRSAPLPYSILPAVHGTLRTSAHGTTGMQHFATCRPGVLDHTRPRPPSSTRCIGPSIMCMDGDEPFAWRCSSDETYSIEW
jgi:hypothetical protein